MSSVNLIRSPRARTPLRTLCCGADLLDVLDVDMLDEGDHAVWVGCCAAGQFYAEQGDYEGVLGMTLEAALGVCGGHRVSRVELGQTLRRGREVELAQFDGLIVEEFEIEVVVGGPAQREVFAAVGAHHRHHKAPVGWHFGLRARRGSRTIGVAVCGRPVSRRLEAQGVVEVTRVCTFGDRRLRRDAASALYRGAAKEYRRRAKGTRLVTYTLETESGASCRAAGMTDEGLAGGGSWDRAGRPREDKAPTTRKRRWSLPLTG